jgi:hypothetical protein
VEGQIQEMGNVSNINMAQKSFSLELLDQKWLKFLTSCEALFVVGEGNNKASLQQSEFCVGVSSIFAESCEF